MKTAITLIDEFISMAPFLLSILLQVASPKISGYAEQIVRNEGDSRDAPEKISESAVDWSRYAFDSVQMVTTYLFTIIIGSLVLTHRGIHVIYILILVFAGLSILVLTFREDSARWMTSYVCKYSPAAFFGIVMNIGVILGILFTSPLIT